MPDDPYTDPVTGVLRNKLGLSTAAELEAAEREIRAACLRCRVYARLASPRRRPQYRCFCAAIMRGDGAPMRKMLDELVQER
jgi:hypothetical protein